MLRPMPALLTVGMGLVVACTVLPHPTLPLRVAEAVARSDVTVSAPQSGDVPEVGQAEALAV